MTTLTCRDLAYLAGDLDELAMHDPRDQRDCSCGSLVRDYPEPEECGHMNVGQYERLCSEIDREHPGYCIDARVWALRLEDGTGVELYLCCDCYTRFAAIWGAHGRGATAWMRRVCAEAIREKDSRRLDSAPTPADMDCESAYLEAS